MEWARATNIPRLGTILGFRDIVPSLAMSAEEENLVLNALFTASI